MFPLEPLVQEQKYKTVHMGDTTLKKAPNACYRTSEINNYSTLLVSDNTVDVCRYSGG